MSLPLPACVGEIASPSERALLDLICHQVDSTMLREIARNDYDEEVEQHRSGIIAQMGSNPPLGLLHWNPREVLELERWSEPDPCYSREHRKRMLACAILLRNVAYVRNVPRGSEEEYFIETSAVTVLQLVLSALAIGDGCPRLAAGFLAWLYGSSYHPAFSPFVAFGCLLLALNEGVREPDLQTILGWVVSVEAEARRGLARSIESERWLVGLNTFEDRSDFRKRWAAVLTQILDQRQQTGPTTEALRNLAVHIDAPDSVP